MSNNELDTREGHDGKVPGEDAEPPGNNSHPEEEEQEARRTARAVRENDSNRESGRKELRNVRVMELT